MRRDISVALAVLTQYWPWQSIPKLLRRRSAHKFYVKSTLGVAGVDELTSVTELRRVELAFQSPTLSRRLACVPVDVPARPHVDTKLQTVQD